MSIAKYLGRYKEVLDKARKNSFSFGRGDKYDITQGNDYTKAISSEYSYLAMAETVPLFIDKVNRKSLKQYRKREVISKGHGDIIICLDESSSTSGEPIAWGKALALTLMQAAHANKCNCVIIRFSGIGEVYPHYFPYGVVNTDEIMNLADSFLGGGTEFKGPLSKAVEIVEKENYLKADLLFVTDGDCDADSSFIQDFNCRKKELNISVTGVVLDKGTFGSNLCLNKFCDRTYLLSEMTEDRCADELIKKIA